MNGFWMHFSSSAVLTFITTLWAPLHEIGHVFGGIVSGTDVRFFAWDKVLVSDASVWIVNAGGIISGFGFIVGILALLLRFARKVWWIPFCMWLADFLILKDTIRGDFGENYANSTMFVLVLYVYVCLGVMVYLKIKDSRRMKAKTREALASRRRFKYDYTTNQWRRSL